MKRFSSGWPSDARSRGYQVIVCGYDGLDVPVLAEVAQNLELVEGQELSDEQMQALTRAMSLMAEEA